MQTAHIKQQFRLFLGFFISASFHPFQQLLDKRMVRVDTQHFLALLHVHGIIFG